MESSVKQRIKEFISLKNLSVREFERLCGFYNGFVKDLKKADRHQIIFKIL